CVMLLACGKAKEQDVPVVQATQSTELRKMTDRAIRIHGRIRATNKSNSGHQFLNFYSSEVSVICFRDDVAKFRQTPFSSFVDRDIVLEGILESFKGKLQIKLHDPSQISIAQTEHTLQPSKDGVPPESADGPAQARETKNQRSELPTKPPILRKVGTNHWVSARGLEYRGVDPDGRSRREHILRHAKDDPDRSGPHGVFSAEDDEVFALIDEAWHKIETQKIRPRTEGQRVAYTVPMGRRVGYLGGTAGRDRGHPPLDRIFIVLDEGTHNVVTAFPK
ncbi:MAG: OB-fold nucleic acid binding domain-containing protein, partial [Planctomycetota bacterium]|nr:OB-fold nucleic acid binding domain-containing protein [Planctomycetota bacterium]